MSEPWPRKFLNEVRAEGLDVDNGWYGEWRGMDFRTHGTIIPLEVLCDDRRHLICLPYSRKNLHRMAAELGLKRHWFHCGRCPHYDIPLRREAEIRARARQVPVRELLELIKRATGAEKSLKKQ